MNQTYKATLSQYALPQFLPTWGGKGGVIWGDLEGWSRDPMFEKYPSISPYTYCANNPMKFVDPTGNTLEEGDGDPPPGMLFINQTKKTTPPLAPNSGENGTATNSPPKPSSSSKPSGTNNATSQSNNQQQSSSQNSTANFPDANTSNAVSLVQSVVEKSKITQIAEKAKVANYSFSLIKIGVTVNDIYINEFKANNTYNLVTGVIGMCGLPGTIATIMMDAYKDGGTYFINSVQELNVRLPKINNPTTWVP